VGVGVDALGAGAVATSLAIVGLRGRGDRNVRLLVEPYRNDRAAEGALEATFVALHALLGPHRGLTFEVHLDRRPGGAPLVWFAVVCPSLLHRQVQAAVRVSYPNARLRAIRTNPISPPFALRLHREAPLHLDDERAEGRSAIEPLLGAMAAAGPPVTVRLVLRPASRFVELLRSSKEGAIGPLLWAAPVVLARDRDRARAVASALSVGGPRLRARRLARRGAMAAPRLPRSLFRPAELARLWCLPQPEYTALPTVRTAVPLAPAPPEVSRARDGGGLLRDEHGGVTIEPALRRQHTAVVGAVDQGKTSFLVASTREDLRREDCAVIVIDPKGDAADAVLSIIPKSRTCTLLDMAAPRAGFNPLAVDAAPDAVADQVVAALRGLFGDGEVKGSSDRYLRNAVIAVLACDPGATLWDVARVLEVSDAGRAFRAAVADRLVELPSYAELVRFFGEELPAQLADARATTTAKLDAPANKLARVLNSPAVKRVLLNESIRIDFDRLIEHSEVLVVRGALGEIGAGNVAVLLQLLLGMLDAALSRVQDRRPTHARRAVALKVDEAPLAINAAFAQTLALKRSAGLETVACWQTDAQWEPELRAQLDALFAHRVLFATASAADAREASALLMSEFADQIRGGDDRLARLASPDVRLHLPRHAALASWTTSAGRARPFVATTIALPFDAERIEWHASVQRARGGREVLDPAAPFRSTAWRELAPVSQSPLAGSQLRATAPRQDAGAPQSPPRRQPATSPSDAARPAAGPAPVVPGDPPESYRELVAMDAAGRIRRRTGGSSAAAVRLAPSDRELLAWLAAARCALTSQIHRRCNQGRSLTVTQRQLKRLADGGLISRFQLYRDDGGGIPLCCVVTERTIELLGITGRQAPHVGHDALDGLRTDVHVVGWLLALEQRCCGAVIEVLGPGRAAIRPQSPEPGALPLGDDLYPRDFLATRPDGSRGPVARFAAVRPSAVVAFGPLPDGRRDLLVVADEGDRAHVLEAYDHLLSGWWRSVARYQRHGVPPTVVVLCANERRALAQVECADRLLTACIAHPGTPPAGWPRPGRDGIHFVAEERVHRGDLGAWRVQELPASSRGGTGCVPSPCELLQLPPTQATPDSQPPWR
jgi:Replication-relaxation